LRTVTALPLTLSTPLHSWLMVWPLARVHCTVQPFVATDELLVTVTVVCHPPGQELSTWYDAPHPVPAEVGVGDALGDALGEVVGDGLALGLGEVVRDGLALGDTEGEVVGDGLVAVPPTIRYVTSERAGTVALKAPPLIEMVDCAAVLLVEFVRNGVTVPLDDPVPLSE